MHDAFTSFPQFHSCFNLVPTKNELNSKYTTPLTDGQMYFLSKFQISFHMFLLWKKLLCITYWPALVIVNNLFHLLWLVFYFQFNGVYNFRYPLSELEHFVPTLDGMEIHVTATVGERFLDEVIEGYSIARAFNSSIRVAFMGGSPQVFKPSMPFTVYVSY